MSTLTNEYLDDLIKTKIFKDFDTWSKDDFHFLLSLLNYPYYTDLALIILSNLKNWILYSNGVFFYPLEQLQKILDKYHGLNYYVNYDIFKEINKPEINEEKENIKLNIQKTNNNEDNLLTIDLENGLLNIGNFLSIDTFKFFIYIILFFILFVLVSIFSYNSNKNYHKNLNNLNYFDNFDNFDNFDSLFNNKENYEQKPEQKPEQKCNIFNNLFNNKEIPEQINNIFNNLFNKEIPEKKDNLFNNKENSEQKDNFLNSLFNNKENPEQKGNIIKNIFKYLGKNMLI